MVSEEKKVALNLWILSKKINRKLKKLDKLMNKFKKSAESASQGLFKSEIPEGSLEEHSLSDTQFLFNKIKINISLAKRSLRGKKIIFVIDNVKELTKDIVRLEREHGSLADSKLFVKMEDLCVELNEQAKKMKIFMRLQKNKLK